MQSQVKVIPMTTTTSVSRNSQKESRQNGVLAALKKFWEFSNFYGEYTAIAPQDRRNYVESLAQKQRQK
jgi:hypothetical protein